MNVPPWNVSVCWLWPGLVIYLFVSNDLIESCCVIIVSSCHVSLCFAPLPCVCDTPSPVNCKLIYVLVLMKSVFSFICEIL